MHRQCKHRQRGGCVPGRRGVGVIAAAAEAPRRVKYVPKRQREESDEDMDDEGSELRTKLAKLDSRSDPAAILKKKAMRGGCRMRMSKKRRGMRGKGKVLDFFKKNLPKVNDFLRKTKALSKIGRFVEGVVPAQYKGVVGTVSGSLDKLGYGYPRGRGRRGGALRLAGMR